MLDVNDVTDNQVSDRYFLDGSKGSSEDEDGGVVDLVLDLQELLLLDPVTEGGYKGGEKHSDVDCQGFNIRSFALTEN